ncbi:hypothetical protein B0F90DRAFT_1672049 [Multifurca ochricompacta]|uniref:Uncharacterized protein n=1 Tax=Multifurca ochricompacta TaxID=376703 RepID=A0AAD4LU58_9AGAM|nr:hypothetical protein B0F90DRAFT_1672049 [Multifurca ochricompacta]
MSSSAAITPPSPLPLGSSNKYDPALKPNPHPYAIKTTHTALLSRSNSSGHNSPSKYFYTPLARPSSRSPTKSEHGYRGHRYSTSLTGELSYPLPSPLPSPVHSQRSHSEDEDSIRRQRADTLPTYLANNSNSNAASMKPEDDLPLNPKTWTPSQLSVYLTTALRVRSGECLPDRVARDITSWIRREGVSGRIFLRWMDEDIKALGVNTLWRGALLAASRNLRQNILRGRIWGHPASDLEQELEQEQGDENSTPFETALYASSSSSLDLSLAGRDVDPSPERHVVRRMRLNGDGNSRVRGMVDKWERESASSRSSSRNSNHSNGHRGSEGDSESEEPGSGEVEMDGDDVNAVADGLAEDHFPDGKGVEALAVEEPSIEDLLATESLAPKDGSWGARAWEELDIGTTIRRIEAHDTVVPRRDGSGSSGSGSGRMREVAKEEAQPARPTVADIFAEPVDTASAPALADAEVQVDPYAEAEAEAEAKMEAELEAKERELENEVRDARALLEEFRRRLEQVEARVGAMEAEWRTSESEQQILAQHHHHQQQQQQSQLGGTPKETYHDKGVEALEFNTDIHATEVGETVLAEEEDTKRERHLVPLPREVDLGPTTVSDLPSYVLFVGFGVCAVVLQVVLKRVVGRNMKP